MGNSSSSAGKGHQDDSVDFGALTPQGVYTGPRDWNQQIVGQQIVERRLAPFYRPLEDYEDGWDDEKILAHRKELPELVEGAGDAPGSASRESTHSGRHHKRGGSASTAKESNRLNEASLYRGAAECPICFLYYPPNINHCRCCDQVICTECFVQIKRAEPDVTHLVSEPAACPYCVQPDFGVVYTPPKWRAGIGSEGAPPPSPSAVAAPQPIPPRTRRKSFGPNDPNVITTDMIRPDWEQKLAAVKATAARRANRRIIMRQVGDRLIPVGISSGRVQVLPDGEGAGGEQQGEGSGGSGSRRSRRRERELSRLMGMIGGSAGNYPGNVIGAQDLEELMIAEAMRLSLLEEEERQRKEQEEQAKKGKARAEGGEGTSTPDAVGPSGSGSSDIQLPPVTGPSLLPPSAGTESSTSLDTGERGRPGHRQSSSISSLGVAQSPFAGGNNARARSQPPFSAIAAGLRSAAGAAVAVGSPGPAPAASSEGTTPARSGTHTPVLGTNASSSSSAVPTPTVPPSLPSPPLMSPLEVPSVRVTTPVVHIDSPLEMVHSAAPISEAATAGDPDSSPRLEPAGDGIPSVGTSSPRPVPAHADSFASTFSVDSEAGGSTYDVLESDDESDGVAHEPLLRSETPVTRQD